MSTLIKMREAEKNDRGTDRNTEREREFEGGGYC